MIPEAYDGMKKLKGKPRASGDDPVNVPDVAKMDS